MARTIHDRRSLERGKAESTRQRADEALERLRIHAEAVSDEELARLATAARDIDWVRIGSTLQGRIAVDLIAAAATQAPPEASYLTTGEAAAALGVSINTLKKWVRLGLIRDAYRTEGGHLRVSADDVARVVSLNRDLAETPDLRPVPLERPATPWRR